MKTSELNSSKIAISIDIDWACEAAIELTLDYFEKKKVPVTVFTTHNSKVVKDRLKNIEVGLHPYFDTQSSHGDTIEKTVATVLNLPHNLNAYRCHRFLVSNEIQEAMKQAGMKCASNVCTNLEIIPPFFNRFNLLEIPIFIEDGAYLYNNHPLEMSSLLKKSLVSEGLKTLLIHPMHFVLNSPNWEYMVQIKKKCDRKKWNEMAKTDLLNLKNHEKGIGTLFKSLMEESMDLGIEYTSIKQYMEKMINKDYQQAYL